MKKINLLFITCCLPFLLGASISTDPTRPPNVDTSSESSMTASQPLNLTAIFIYPSYRFALINGQMLKEGDHVNEYTITSIKPNTVELDTATGAKETLQLALTIKQEK